MHEQKLIEAYARLKALKANLPETYSIEEKYVQEFHAILSILEQASGDDLKNFRVPASEVRPRGLGGDRVENKCDRSYLMMRIDGVSAFFEVQMTSQRASIGFSAR